MHGWDVLATVYAALAGLAAPNNLITLASPVDFSKGGKLAQWCAPEVLDIDRIVEVFGNLPATLIEAVFTMMRPTAKTRAALRFFDHADEPRAHEAYSALAQWSDDWIPVPGRAAREWITDFYQHNQLITGGLRIGGEEVDLRRISAPALAIAAESDEISPPASIAPFVDVISSVDRTLLVLPGGHIGLVAGRAARNVLWPQLREWLGTRKRKGSRVSSAISVRFLGTGGARASP